MATVNDLITVLQNDFNGRAQVTLQEGVQLFYTEGGLSIEYNATNKPDVVLPNECGGVICAGTPGGPEILDNLTNFFDTQEFLRLPDRKKAELLKEFEDAKAIGTGVLYRKVKEWAREGYSSFGCYGIETIHRCDKVRVRVRLE